MSKTVFTYQNVLRAYYHCRKRKRRTLSALGFECNLEANLAHLTQALQTRTYVPDRSVYFVVTKPKPREIFAAEFLDRITHHILINEVEKIWEKHIFVPHSCACRKGKGHHYAMRCLSQQIKNFDYFGQFDISNFFSSIDKDILYTLFSEVIKTQHRPDWWKDDVLWLSQVIIFTDPTKGYFYKGDPKLKELVPQQKSLFNQPTDIGMPIGNLSSQFLANVYLHELDDYVLNTLKIPGFVRYVDDFVILSNSKEEIISARNQIKIFLDHKLGMKLHPKKQQIQPTNHGVPFVGYFVKPTGVTIRRNVIKSAKKELYYAKVSNRRELIKLVATLNSYYGHFRQARSYTLRQHLFKQHLPLEVQSQMWTIGPWESFRPVKKLNTSQPRKKGSVDKRR